MFFYINVCAFSNLKDNNEGETNCQNGPELLRLFIRCAGPGRLSVVLVPEKRDFFSIFVLFAALHMWDVDNGVRVLANVLNPINVSAKKWKLTCIFLQCSPGALAPKAPCPPGSYWRWSKTECDWRNHAWSHQGCTCTGRPDEVWSPRWRRWQKPEGEKTSRRWRVGVFKYVCWRSTIQHHHLNSWLKLKISPYSLYFLSLCPPPSTTTIPIPKRSSVSRLNYCLVTLTPVVWSRVYAGIRRVATSY